MGICPVCNGFEEIQSKCQECGDKLEDQGRIMDYYDDYSPYMPIDLMKLEDGYEHDVEKGECPHLIKCPSCGHDEITFIKE